LGGIDYLSLDIGLFPDRFPFLPELNLDSDVIACSSITISGWTLAGVAIIAITALVATVTTAIVAA